MAYNYGGRKLYVLVVSLKQNKTKDLGEGVTCSADGLCQQYPWKKTKNLKLIFVVAVDGVCCHPGSLFGKKKHGNSDILNKAPL